MKIYAISGLGADSRVFKFLNLKCDLIPLEWITPIDHEPIADYAQRLSKRIDTSQEFGLIGLSFGGLVAVEISKILNPKITILISSVEENRELRPIYRFFGKLNIIKILPNSFFNMPKIFAQILFDAKNKELLNAILADTDSSFVKWAISQLVTWENKDIKANTVKINGTSDKLIPHRNKANEYLIDGGGHFMIVDRAHEISKKIDQIIEET